MRLPDRQSGVTMIEVVAVLVIITILSAVAIARFTDFADADLKSQVEVVKGHLRLAQARALATGNEWGINFSSSKTYFLFEGAAPSTPVLLLGEEEATVDLETKKSELRISSAPLVVTFDAYGNPGSSTITIATTGDSIIVTRNTGFIP
jgi:MSHA pilin protein MshC